MVKTAIVTGASRGIGRAIAIRLAQMGYQLLISARSKEDLEETARLCQDSPAVEVFPADLSDRECPEKIVKKVEQRFGRLDVLVNNAGNGGGGNIKDADMDRWDLVLDLNFRAIVHLTHRCIPLFDRHQDPKTIINIASMAGHFPRGGAAIYCASKHALVGFSHSIFEDLRGQGIKVCCLSPGFVATEMVKKYNYIEENMIQLKDLADCVTFVINSSATVCPVEILLRPQLNIYPENKN